jgi:hypothetical protein
MRHLRAWLAEAFGIRDDAAKNGEWWEIDFVIVILFGAILAGVLGALAL